MRWIKIAAVAALLQLLLLGGASAQTQMLLPYNQAIFQSTWENPAVRPEHRYSLGLPILSSIELGVINNGFMLKDVSKLRNGALYVQGNLLQKELAKNPYNLAYSEFSFDLLHFRMAWKNYYFWFGARTVINESFLYARDIANFVIGGNKQFVGKNLNLSDMAFNVQAYHEFSLGFSRVVENLVIGARLSLLAGLGNSFFDPKQIDLSISDKDENLYAHTGQLNVKAYASGVPLEVKDNNSLRLGNLNPTKVSWVNFKNPGAALSAAVAWRPEPRTNLTLAVADLGFIYWGDKITEITAKTNKVYFDGFQGFTRMMKAKSFDFNLLHSDVQLPFKKGSDDLQMKNGGHYMTWLAPKLHLMATYDLARQTTAGVSFSATFNQKQFYPSVTLSIQQGFSNLFHLQLAASYNQRSFLNFGAGLVFCPGPVQFYLVTDNFFAFIKPTMAKATNVRLGINFVWGAFYPNNHQLTHE